MTSVNAISLAEAENRFCDFNHIVKKFDRIEAIGIHGSLTAGSEKVAKDADYIVMLNRVSEPIGTDNETNAYADKVISVICKDLNGELGKSYVSENLSLIGHSILTRDKKKLSFHFVSLTFCQSSIESLSFPNQQIDCIFSTEITPTKVYRLWVKDTIILFDRNGDLRKLKKKAVDRYHTSIIPYVREHLFSSINQYCGCHDKSAQYLLRQSVVNAAVLLVYAFNNEFFGSPKKLLKDLNNFKIKKNESCIIQDLLEHPNSDNSFNELIRCFNNDSFRF
ncbi:MAG TPA: hypothetical protein ENH23_03410 [candidate division Zixibacteria bacterium]|nr:hypothetical protein [candidate division Zixibacteria bacterium]